MDNPEVADNELKLVFFFPFAYCHVLFWSKESKGGLITFQELNCGVCVEDETELRRVG